MNTKAGVMIIGARGHLATTLMVGTQVLTKGLCSTIGMVSALDAFSHLTLIPPEQLVFGGWDIRATLSAGLIRQIVSDIGPMEKTDIDDMERTLTEISADIFPGTTLNSGKAIAELMETRTEKKPESVNDVIKRLKQDISRFREKHAIEDIVVVNLSSTEPPLPIGRESLTLARLEQLVENNESDAIRAGTLYAYAAIDSGCIYINFTPSESALVPGLIELAEKRSVPIMGSDGKTGETLVKSVLAPMFAYRNLAVLSWQGYNMLGNLDGQILSNDSNKSSKLKTKDKVLSKILGYKPHSQVAIDFVPSLGDRKTAWDFIHFEGFLNTKMSLQFTWQGSDSALAAPLVLDLIRFGILARQNKEIGLMKHLASFFKSPEGVEEYDMHRQFRMLLDYAAAH